MNLLDKLTIAFRRGSTTPPAPRAGNKRGYQEGQDRLHVHVRRRLLPHTFFVRQPAAALLGCCSRTTAATTAKYCVNRCTNTRHTRRDLAPEELAGRRSNSPAQLYRRAVPSPRRAALAGRYRRVDDRLPLSIFAQQYRFNGYITPRLSRRVAGACQNSSALFWRPPEAA